ncbi:MAG: hypothetical protein AAGC63_16120 [Propionicimonas sp.]
MSDLDLDRLLALAEAAITPDDCDYGTWELEERRSRFGILRNFGRDRFGCMWHAYVIHDAAASDRLVAAVRATSLVIAESTAKATAAVNRGQS